MYLKDTSIEFRVFFNKLIRFLSNKMLDSPNK